MFETVFVLWSLSTVVVALETEPQCSRYDYDHKIITALVTMEIEQKELRKVIVKQNQLQLEQQTTLQQLEQTLREQKEVIEQFRKSQDGASVYVRWGRSVCPGNGTSLVHTGIIGGTHLSATGGPSNSLCLADNPTWNQYIDGVEGWKSAIYGSEVDDATVLSMKAFGYDYGNQDPPCAVCHTSRPAIQMFPGRSNCYAGWTMEYTGYLVGGNPGHHSNTDYICLDSRPEKLPHGLDATRNDQHNLYFVEGHCGSLPCPPYHQGREIACVVCSK